MQKMIAPILNTSNLHLNGADIGYVSVGRSCTNEGIKHDHEKVGRNLFLYSIAAISDDREKCHNVTSETTVLLEDSYQSTPLMHWANLVH